MGPPTRSLLATWSKASSWFWRPVSSASSSRNMALARAALKSARARNLVMSSMGFRLPFDNAVGVDVDHLRIFVARAGDGVTAINMRVSMQQQARLKDIHEPAKGLKTRVGQVSLVVDAARGRVGHQDIQVAAIAQPVQRQARRQAEGAAKHLGLGVLVAHILVISQAAAQARQQQPRGGGGGSAGPWAALAGQAPFLRTDG